MAFVETKTLADKGVFSFETQMGNPKNLVLHNRPSTINHHSRTRNHITSRGS